MRIALNHTHFSRSGGVEGYLHQLATRLLDAGHEVDVFCRRARDVPDHPGLTVETVETSSVSRARRAWSFARNSRAAIERADRERHYDAIHGFTKNSYWNSVFRDGGGCHQDYCERYLDRFERGPLRRLQERRYDRAMLEIERLRFGEDRGQIVYANSEWVRSQILGRHDALPPERVRVLHNPVDLERFRPERREKGEALLAGLPGLDPAARRLAFVGNDFRRKGLDELLPALAELAGEGALGSWQLLVIGHDRREAQYRAKAAELGLSDTVSFLGRRNDTPDLLAACHVLVLPTHFDAFPNVVVEGLASGLPALVSRETGACEVVEEKRSGWVVDAVAPGPIAHALREALAVEDLRPWAERARTRALDLDWTSHLARVLEIYAESAERLSRQRRNGELPNA